MENKINVAELLKDCPEGTELDCAMYDNLYFESCQSDYYDNTIKCYTLIGGIKTIIIFTKYGTFNKHSGAKCVIFPKGKTSWKGFTPRNYKFKNGDIVATKSGKWIFIVESLNGTTDTFHIAYDSEQGKEGRLYFKKTGWGFSRSASAEEKERLFKALKDNGYKWNAETKTLEKLIEPKFKVGDKVRVKNGVSKYRIIEGVFDTFYSLQMLGRIDFTEQDRWELVPNKFDISTLKPYKSEVLYRNTLNGRWKPAFWGAYTYLEGHQSHKFLTTNGFAHYCIPYEGNEHLMGKQDDCSGYYKTWEE